MGAAIFGVKQVDGALYPILQLLLEIVVGAIAYIAAALVLCRATAKDLLGLLRQALRRRSKDSSPSNETV